IGEAFGAAIRHRYALLTEGIVEVADGDRIDIGLLEEGRPVLFAASAAADQAHAHAVVCADHAPGAPRSARSHCEGSSIHDILTEHPLFYSRLFAFTRGPDFLASTRPHPRAIQARRLQPSVPHVEDAREFFLPSGAGRRDVFARIRLQGGRARNMRSDPDG